MYVLRNPEEAVEKEVRLPKLKKNDKMNREILHRTQLAILLLIKQQYLRILKLHYFLTNRVIFLLATQNYLQKVKKAHHLPISVTFRARAKMVILITNQKWIDGETFLSLNSIFGNRSEKIPIFSNGHKSTLKGGDSLVTMQTCGFDSLFHFYLTC